MRTVFVTGAEGFAGRHLIRLLKQRNYDPVAGVRNRARKLAHERSHVKAIVCDVSDAINVGRAIASVRPDAIVHLAGMTRPFEALADPLAAYQSIVTGWANVLDGARRAVPRAKLLMFSSCDVYGDAAASGGATREDTPLSPVGPFGAFKATAESIAHTFHRSYHLDVTIARPFHFTGPEQSEHSFFGAVARQIVGWDVARQGSELRLPDLSCERDVLHVADVVEATVLLLEHGRPNEVYNICSGRTRTIRQLVEVMLRTAGRNLTLVEVRAEPPQQQVRRFCGDHSKLTAETGWEPKHTPEQAVTELVQSLRTAASPSASSPAPH